MTPEEIEAFYRLAYEFYNKDAGSEYNYEDLQALIKLSYKAALDLSIRDSVNEVY